MTTPAPSADLLQWTANDSQMARRLRDADWRQTSLGPVEQWPPALRTAINMCLDCGFPIIIWWGPDLTFFYNDEYLPSLGSKHLWAFGQPGAKVWAEIWDVIGPMLTRVMTHREATRSRDLRLHIERHGYLEETYFSFSYSPILDTDGKVGGIFCPVIETTDKVIGERRLRTLRDLGADRKGAQDEAAIYASSARVLADNPGDVPFALVYRIDESATSAQLEAVAGIEAGGPSAPVAVPLDGDGSLARALAEVVRTGTAASIDDLPAWVGPLPGWEWPVRPQTALALPLSLPGQERPHAVLVAAASPMRALDDVYRTFFSLVATQIASGLADAQALEAERQRTRALAEIDRAKTVFFSNVSHEFRTPLTLILGPVEDALAEPDAPWPRERVELVHRNALRLQRLVNAILDFSRIEAGRLQANYAPVDLASLTRELASVFRSAAEKAGLAFTVSCAPLAEPVYVDPDLYEKIVLNLLSNAFKFTLSGEIAVTLADAGDAVTLSVRDTGAGIAPEEIPNLFRRFHRIEGVHARTHEGTGLGLAFVQELTRLHGGSVGIESTVGVGSTFTVTLPKGKAHLPAERIGAPRADAFSAATAAPFVAEALQLLPSTPQPSPAAAAADGQRARIVWADDNADMREYVSRLLAPQYDVEAVADGQAALASVERRPPDLVLADVMMPGLDGFALLHALKAHPRTRFTPVILLSARAGEEAKIEGLHAGADAYLVKPFSARELLARVDAHLRLARLRAEANDAIRGSEQRLSAIVEQLPVGVGVMALDGTWILTNATMDGYVRGAENASPADDALYWQAWDERGRPIAPADWPAFRALRGETVVPGLEMRYTPPAGEPHWMRVSAAPLSDGTGAVVGACVVVQDVTLVKSAESALREADRRKDEFLATLAHELRNPLAVLSNGLRVIRLKATGVDPVHGMLERQVGLLARLVDDLMEVSRIAGGKVELRRQPTELAGVLRAAVESGRPAIDAAQHRLDVDVGDEPLLVDADPMRLTQVIANLLHNAAKYTDGNGDIRLDARRDGDDAVVTVQDNGIGIPDEMLDKVFDMFTQVERDYHRAQGGLGIGLTLVRSLVEMHGGNVRAYSDGPGCGSRFVVRLPLMQPLKRVRQTAIDAPRPAMPSAHRVLVVDDNADAAESLRLVLLSLGLDALAVNDGFAALAALDSYRPSLVLLDIGMPKMDGLEFARRARRHAAGASLTLIALSGWGQEQDRRRSKEAGIDYHLVKPLDVALLEQLLSVVEATRRR